MILATTPLKRLKFGALLLSAALLTACAPGGQGSTSPSNSQTTSDQAPPPADPRSPKKCVQVYYDDEEVSDVNETNPGRLHAIMLLNLLGHFPSYQRIAAPISNYHSGDIEKCDVSFYVGSDYNATVPDAFTNDYLTTRKTVVWMGYSFWDLGSALPNIFGFKFNDFTTFDTVHKDSNGMPSFYRDVAYKGETFTKFVDWSENYPDQIDAAYEIAILVKSGKGQSEVLATIKDSYTKKSLPWAIRHENKYIFSEVPFSYTAENDRYVVFADMLFDILNEQPKHFQKLALLRLEDIHAYTNLTLLNSAVSILRSSGIVPHISLVPVFYDPLGNYLSTATPKPIPMTEKLDFLQNLHTIQQQPTVIIWHGVTHQHGNSPNPFTATTADDFEFWDAVNNRPLQEDSSDYVMQLLNLGRNILKSAGADTNIWLTPHYKASSVDNKVFATTFKAGVGRYSYYQNDLGGPTRFDNYSTDQFYPYEIYGDVNGAIIIPENLDHITPLGNTIGRNRSLTDILADAKRNLVIRDSWASVFYHPFLLEGQKPGKEDLRQLVNSLQALGYQFVNLNDFVNQISQTASPIQQPNVR